MSISVKIKNILTNEENTFLTLKDSANFLNVTREQLISCVEKTKFYPLNNQFVVEITSPEKMFEPTNSYPHSIYVLDNVTGQSFYCESLSLAGYRTGVNPSILQAKLFKSENKNKYQEMYIAGFTFSKSEIFSKKVNHSIAMDDRNNYYKIGINLKNHIKRVQIFNYFLNMEYTFESDKMLKRFFNLTESQLQKLKIRLKREIDKKIILLNGFGVKAYESKMKWGDKSYLEIISSRRKYRIKKLQEI